ncbi:MAG: metallophosphoesterase [Lachnospiraceae bacterium]|nr:metallophosphoesterase [Lachnospiraceae bacterium]
MKVIVVSDTHGRDINFKKVVEMHNPDMVVHCGDVEGKEKYLMATAGCPMHIVAGNNDYFSDLPKEEEFNIGRYKVWLTHGHNYYVSMSPELIRDEAISRGVDIVMYGHTHKPVVYRTPDIIAINPGSLSYPRQEGRKPSYIIMEIDRYGELHFTISYLD